MDDGPRQVEQLVKSKSKDGTQTLELPDVTVQWHVSVESGLHSVLQRLRSARGGSESSERHTTLDSAAATGKFRPLPMRPLVVAVWMYPPHIELPLTGERVPVSVIVKQDFFSEAGEDDVQDNVNVSSEDVIDDLH
ncbi:unnamed protein product [Hyaloperonospora brassicae]|uniref:Uncharacterized protein n=1 Tax=Hyaloperonospora brassicae TaxID=162125 RepID=A0AAV0V155_HYABA|nr:unnamed protein product [Hyaloperonospora brassicae]